MVQQRRVLLPFLMLIICSLLLPLYDALREVDPDENHVKEAYGYDPQAYPSYFSAIEDDNFSDTIKLEADVLSLRSFEKASGSSQTVSVANFGAKGDGRSDDTQAFLKAWNKACSSPPSKTTVLLVPKGKSYLLKPIRFSGPCKSSNLTIQIFGTLEASKDRSHYKEDTKHWLVFDGVNNLSVEGGGSGIVDGNGKIWWKNSCKVNKANPCRDAPTALTFHRSKNLRVNNLKVMNAQQIQVSFDGCSNVQASDLQINAPGDSPNTDGIHVTGTKNIHITNSIIRTGDDCISIVSGSQNVQANDITCGPGHGISIGSLGDGNSKAQVSGVIVNGAKLIGTDNGVRIKTWQGGSGLASNIVFQNIQMENVKNPIIIDQNYCDQDGPCKRKGSAVQVENVMYQNIKGTSASDVAIKFDCSQSYPCRGILLQDVDIDGGKASCSNVEVTERGNVSPSCA